MLGMSRHKFRYFHKSSFSYSEISEAESGSLFSMSRRRASSVLVVREHDRVGAGLKLNGEVTALVFNFIKPGLASLLEMILAAVGTIEL